MLLRSDWLILSVKDWCCINCSVSVSLSSPLPEPPGYFISDRQHKQEPGVTQVLDGAEQTSICASWDALYTLSELDWLGSTGQELAQVVTVGVHRVPHQLEILDRIPDVLPFLPCELTLSKREQESINILLIEGRMSPGSTWASGSSVRAPAARAQAKCMLCK